MNDRSLTPRMNAALPWTLLLCLVLVGGLLSACGSGADSGGDATSQTAKPAKPKKSAGSSGSSATGNLVVEGDWHASYSSVEKGSKVYPNPIEETLILRLNLDGGEGDYPKALVDMSRLPASLAEGTYSLGSGQEVRGEVILRPKNPADSGLRFAFQSGQLVIRSSGDEVSASFEGEAEEVTFNKQERVIQVRGEFAGVAVKQK